MDVVFYSTHCPKCKVIETKLQRKGIEYQEINDLSVMLEMGFKSAPMLVVDDQAMDFVAANKWLSAYGRE